VARCPQTVRVVRPPLAHRHALRYSGDGLVGASTTSVLAGDFACIHPRPSGARSDENEIVRDQRALVDVLERQDIGVVHRDDRVGPRDLAHERIKGGEIRNSEAAQIDSIACEDRINCGGKRRLGQSRYWRSNDAGQDGAARCVRTGPQAAAAAAARSRASPLMASASAAQLFEQSSGPLQQVRKLGEVCRHAARLIPGEPLHRLPPSALVLEIEIGERLLGRLRVFLDGPERQVQIIPSEGDQDSRDQG
jgi:hypothetical protein